MREGVDFRTDCLGAIGSAASLAVRQLGTKLVQAVAISGAGVFVEQTCCVREAVDLG